MYQYLLIFGVLLCIIHTLFSYSNLGRYIKLINKIPGPNSIPIVGSTMKYYRVKHEDLLPDLQNDINIFGPTFRHWCCGVAAVVVSDIDDVQTVLTSNLHNRKGLMYKNVKAWLGTGLLTSTGRKWQTMRKIVTPAFHFSILQEYVDVFNRNSKIMLGLLRDCDQEKCALNEYITYCALDSISETAMGTFMNSQVTKAESDYVRAIFGIGRITVERLFRPYLFPNKIFGMSYYGRKQKKLLGILHGFTSKVAQLEMLPSCFGARCQIIEEKKAAMESGTEEKKPNPEEDKVKKVSFLEILLEKQKTHSFSDVDIREEVDTFLMAGHDTTATALTWAFFEMGHHPDIQEKVYEEMKVIFGDSDRPSTYQDLMEMSYLKRVLQETLRKYPSVPVITRRFHEDLQLKNYVLPAKTEVVLIIYLIHRNPEIYPNPENFDPDRFLPEVMDKRNSFAYIPFSAGKRNCIGQKYAMLQMLALASSIIRKYKIISLDDKESVKPQPDMVLRPNKKLTWRIIPRKETPDMTTEQ